MSIRVCTLNKALGVVPTVQYDSGGGLAAASAASGYSFAHLVDNVLGRAVRMNEAGSAYEIEVDFGAATALNFYAVFDAMGQGVGPSHVNQVSLLYWTGAAWATASAAASVNSRGDYGTGFVSQSATKYRVRITMDDATKKLELGLIVLGVYTDMPRTFQVRKDKPTRMTGLSESEAWAVRMRSMRRVIEVDFSVLQQSEHDALESLNTAVDGSFLPFVYQPNLNEVLFGRIEDTRTWSQHLTTLYEAEGLVFREMERAL